MVLDEAEPRDRRLAEMGVDARDEFGAAVLELERDGGGDGEGERALTQAARAGEPGLALARDHRPFGLEAEEAAAMTVEHRADEIEDEKTQRAEREALAPLAFPSPRPVLPLSPFLVRWGGTRHTASLIRHRHDPVPFPARPVRLV
jgi:hypothetical protein